LEVNVVLIFVPGCLCSEAGEIPGGFPSLSRH